MADEGPGRAPVSISEAVDAFLANPRRTASGNTYRAYTGVLSRLAETLGTRRALADVDDEEIAIALQTLWGSAAPAHVEPQPGNRRLLAVLVPNQGSLASPGRSGGL